MLTTTTFPTALKKHLFDVWDASYKEETQQFAQVFDVDTTEDAYEDFLQRQGPDSIPQSSEGDGYERLDSENVRSKRYEPGVFKGEMKITREALDDYKYKQLTDATKDLAVAASQTVERLAVAFFINGFTSEMSPDGVSVFNAAHPLSNASSGKPSTGSNYANYQLSPGNVRLVRSAGRHTPNEHGYVAPVYLTDLIVGPDLEDAAEVIKNSTLLPGSNANDKNETGTKIKNIYVLDFLADYNMPYAWWMRDPKRAKNKLFWRVKPERKIVEEEGTGDFLFRIYFRVGLGCHDWRGLYGCDATGNQ